MNASVEFHEAGAAAGRPLLEIKDLAISFTTSNGEVNAVRNAHLTVMPGETVAIVGESGSGKSTTALAAIGLLPGNGRVAAGQVLFDGEDIAHASEKRMIELRGNSIGMVPQDPMSNLNPVWKIGYQVRETLKANGLPSGPDDVAKVLSEAGLPDALALDAQPVWPAVAGLLAWSVAKHAFDAVQDIEEDRQVGITTTAVLLGARGTAVWSGAWWLASTALFATVSLPVAAVNLVIAGALVVLLLRRPTPATGHRLYPLSVAFPYIAGSVASGILLAAMFFGVYP